jgi:putative ABC transport system permease protein
MKYLPYVLKHLGKNKIRTLSTIIGMAVCIFLVCVLQTVTEAMRRGLDSAAPDRLITRHHVSLVFNMPNAYGPKLARIPGVKSVAASNWFGGYYQDQKNFFTNFAVESETYFPMHPEFKIPPDQMAEYMRDMRGCVVGRLTAEKYGWKIGDVVPLTSVIPPYQIGRPFEMTVRAIYDVDLQQNPGTDRSFLFFHYKYLYEGTGQRAGIGTFNVQINDPSQSAAIAKAIDAVFENSDVQTKTETERAFFEGFAALGGNLTRLLNAIGLAVAFTILLVSANTMSMAVRERRTEIAVLKTLGFPSALVMALILVEAVVIGVVSGVLGLGFATAFLAIVPKLPGAGALGAFGISNLAVSPFVSMLTLSIALVLSVLAGFTPAWGSYRARITDMLRSA